MGRRGFLETLASLGVSAVVLDGLSKEMFNQLVDDSQKEVPRVLGHIHTNHEEMKKGAPLERKPIYYAISRDRWRRVEGVHDARDRVEAILAGRAEPIDIWVTTNSNNEKQVDVDVYETDSVDKSDIRDIEDELPATIDGVAGRGTAAEDVLEDIPIVVDRTPVPSFEPVPLGRGPDHYWNDWDEVPGGAACYLGKDTHTVSWGSLCTPVDEYGNTKMLTAGHNIDTPRWAPDTEWISGTEPERDANFDPGQVKAGSTTGLDVFDAATIDPRSGVEMTHELAAERGVTEGDIRGRVDEEHLKDIEDNGTDQYFRFMRQGAKTAKSMKFGIDEMGSDAFVTTLHESETKGGDSGGPYYLRSKPSFNLDGDKYVTEADLDVSGFDIIAGVHQGDSTERPYTVATSIYRVEEEFGIKV